MKRLIVLSAAWLSLCVIYIWVFIGWGNLFSLLPHEALMVFVALLVPIPVSAFFLWFSRVARSVEAISSQVGAHARQIDLVARNLNTMVEIARESRDAALADMKAQQLLSANMVRELAVIAEMRSAPPPVPVPSTSGSLEQMRALVEIINVALNDLSMTVTQVLVQLLNAVHGDKDKIQEFMAGLVEAYSVGDKNAFFRSFAKHLAEYPDTLVTVARGSPEVRRDLSKILREVEEIMSLVAGCEQNNLIRIVFEEGELWKLHKSLDVHFDRDGSPKAPEE
ncbi:MAG: hypothetical protein H7841_05755 [Magnetospirillum sp. WYHS-4]